MAVWLLPNPCLVLVGFGSARLYDDPDAGHGVQVMHVAWQRAGSFMQRLGAERHVPLGAHDAVPLAGIHACRMDKRQALACSASVQVARSANGQHA
jgi:hypothetical protein